MKWLVQYMNLKKLGEKSGILIIFLTGRKLDVDCSPVTPILLGEWVLVFNKIPGGVHEQRTFNPGPMLESVVRNNGETYNVLRCKQG